MCYEGRPKSMFVSDEAAVVADVGIPVSSVVSLFNPKRAAFLFVLFFVDCLPTWFDTMPFKFALVGVPLPY